MAAHSNHLHADQWNCGRGCFYAEAAAQVIPNRKVLQGMMHGNDQVVSGSSKVQLGSTTKGYGGAGSETWDQLRGVPAGPDPLHHHGGSPKKPRTP
ncbi:hypothetical protein RHGRI_002148 [Rhododendron griersonianum]|uniref:Uncharacterized protein n=1 Tax=Rhododendron griersonianum TaxID=479676 RepID=A0AAV6LP29_9ERIC|nr:hypothetical protein RHGRI_002148 [Rhododendron griersonianum]